MALNDAVPSSATDVFKRNIEDTDRLLNTSANVVNRVGTTLESFPNATGRVSDAADAAQIAIQADVDEAEAAKVAALASYAQWNSRGDWETATDYAKGDIWNDTNTSTWYLVLNDYTSGATVNDDITGPNVTVLQGAGIQSFEGLSEAITKITANPELFSDNSSVSISSNKTKAECVSAGVDFPDGNGGDYVITTSETLVDGRVIAAGTKQLKLITQKLDLPIENVVKLREFEPTVNGQECTLSGHTLAGIGGGSFYAILNDVGGVDNNGTKFMTAGGHSWNRREKGFVTPEDFGALGDWNGTAGTDDYAAWNNALAASISVRGLSGSRYLLRSALSKNNASVDIDLNGAELIQGGDFDLLTITQDFTDVQSISLIDNTSQIDLRNGDSGSLTTVTSVTVSNGAAYSVNDICKIVSDDIIIATDPANMERRGEFCKVAQVSGNVVSFYSLVREAYTTAPRLAKMSAEHSVSIKNGSFDTDGSINPTWNGANIVLVGCYEPKIDDVYAARTRSEFVELYSCFGAKTNNIVARDQTTSFVNFALGYTLIEYSCENGVHKGLTGYNSRHVYTTGVRSTTAGDSAISNFGSTRDFDVDLQGFNCQFAAADTHPDARGGVFRGSAVMPYNGPNGTQVNVQLRGIGAQVIGFQSTGGRLGRINGSYDHPDTARDNTFTDCHHNFIGVVDQNREAIEITRTNSNDRIQGAVIKGLTTNQPTGEKAQYVIDNANVDIIEPIARCVSTGTGTGNIFEIGVNASVNVSGGSIDYTGSTDTSIVMAQLNNTSSSLVMSGTRIRGQVGVLADLNSANGKFVSKELNFTSAPSTEAGYSNAGSGATIAIDYLVNDGMGANQNNNRATGSINYTTTGLKDLDLEFRGADTVIFSVDTDAAGVGISSITSGTKVGQKLIIRNSSGSSNTLDLVTSGSGGAYSFLNIGVNRTIDVGGSYSLYWAGSFWFSGQQPRRLT